TIWLHYPAMRPRREQCAVASSPGTWRGDATESGSSSAWVWVGSTGGLQPASHRVRRRSEGLRRPITSWYDTRWPQWRASSKGGRGSMADEGKPSLGDAWGDAISDERQAELEARLHAWEQAADHGDRTGPFDGEQLTGADVHWLAARTLAGSDDRQEL